MPDQSAMEPKLTELLTYFQAQQSEYVVTKRLAPLEEQAIRFDFVKGNTHFMFDLTNNLIDDFSAAEVKERLEKSGWWAVLQSHPAPEISIFSSVGFIPRVGPILSV